MEWKLPESIETCWMYIYDLEGRLIDKTEIFGNQNEKVLSTANWKPGTYVISLVSDGVKYGSQKLSIIK